MVRHYESFSLTAFGNRKYGNSCKKHKELWKRLWSPVMDRLGVCKVHVIDRCVEVAGRNGYLAGFWMCLRWKPEQGTEV